MVAKAIINEDEAMNAILGIIGDAPVKAAKVSLEKKTPVSLEKKTPVEKAAAPAGPCIVYEHGKAIEVDGKKVAKGYTPKKKGGSRASKEDAGKDALKAIYTRAIEAVAAHTFIHTSEGLIAREEEADYAIKVSKSKELKFDPSAADFEVEKDFSIRGKAKNSAPKFAKAILAALDSPDFGVPYTLISAKASGIILHMDGGEYTIKISKKRDRVGFEAEKAGAYNG